VRGKNVDVLSRFIRFGTSEEGLNLRRGFEPPKRAWNLTRGLRPPERVRTSEEGMDLRRGY
jgi:hypothetical protein